MAKKKKQQPDDGVALASGNAAAEATDEGGGGGGENEERNEGGDGGKPEKNDGGSITVVLKVDMHCEGCSKKVIKSVRGVQGVETVKADAGIGKLTVVGKLDPWKLRDHVEAKSHKKVDLISPTNFPKNADKDRKPSAAKQTDEKKKPQEKQLVVTTVTLKIRLHCEGCIRRIRKIILKIKGVESVVFDTQTDQVIVKGTMDAKALPEKLKTKMKRDVGVVEPKKEGGGGEKKEKGGAGEEGKKKKDGAGGEKKKKESGEGEKKKKDGGEGEKKKDGGEEKKKGGKGGGGGGGEKEEEETVKAAAMGAAPAGYAMEYYGGYGYRFEMVHAPQLFSDENPNSCSVM